MVSTISCPQPVVTHPNLAIVSMMVPLRATDFDRVRYVHAHLPILLSGTISGFKLQAYLWSWVRPLYQACVSRGESSTPAYTGATACWAAAARSSNSSSGQYMVHGSLRYGGCIGGEKRLDSVQPSNCMGNGSAMRASVLLSLTGKDGNDGNLHREDDFRFHTSVQRWTDDIP